MRVVGCTRVKNGERYIERWVSDMSQMCDFLCVLDDGSDDATPRLLDEAARRHKNLFLHRQKGLPKHEGRDCNALYDMAAALKADWIFAPDVDEFVDPGDFDMVRAMCQVDRPDVLGWAFPFYYLWDDEQHYRADGDYGSCHVIRLFRFDPALRPPTRPTHAQVCPDGVDRRRVRVAPARMLHYGYMDAADRQFKHKYYTEQDKDPMKAGAGVTTFDHIVATEGVVLSKYEGRPAWHDIRKSGPDRIDGSTFRVYIGNGSFPGAATDISADLSGYLDEVIVDDLKCFADGHGFKDLANVLREGGRLDLRTMDMDSWASKFCEASKASNEEERIRLAQQLAGRQPFWEQQVGRELLQAGFERVERLPVDGLHMIAFKKHGEKAQA